MANPGRELHVAGPSRERKDARPERSGALVVRASLNFDSRHSIAVQARQPVGVEIRVAEQLLGGTDALHIEAYVELVGHADAAMHLDGFLNRQRSGDPS